MRSPVMIRLKTPRRWSRALIICLTIFLNLSLVSGPAWAGVGANPPAGNPDDYAGGDWLGTAAVDNYTNDGTVSGDVLLDAGNDVFTNNGQVTGTVRGQNWHDQLTNNASGQIDGTMRGDNGNDTLVNHGTIGNNLDGGNQNDTIENHGTAYRILGGSGDDNITNTGNVTNINGEEDNDTIVNSGTVSQIRGADGNDHITNNGIVNSYILAGDGADTIINNNTVNNNVYGEEGNDTITINGSVNGHVAGDEGDDDITINGYVSGTISGGGGMDYIVVSGRVDGTIQGNGDGDTIKLTTGASVRGVINGGAGSDAIIYEGVADVSAFNISGFSYVTYKGSNGLSGTHSTPVADLHVSGALRLQNGTINAQSLGVWPGTAALTGNGNIACPLTVQMEGSVAPGNSIGTIYADSLEILWDSNYNVEVGGGASDLLIIANNVILTDANLKVSVLSAPLANHKFTIIRKDSAGPVLGTLFTGLPESATFKTGGYLFSISYNGGDGNDVVLTCLGPVPGGDEPEPEPKTLPAPLVEQGSGPSPAGSRDGSQLSWPQVKGATHYRVYRADCPNCKRKEIGRVKGSSFVDNTAEAGRPYYYWLRTENSDGLGVYSNWMAAWRYEQNPGRAGDFNGDGIMDLLWWDPASNQLSIWFMNSGAVKSVSPAGDGLNVAEWLLMATGDFNGDGACDLLWWKPETGETRVWLLDQAMAAAGGAGEWLVKGSADLETMTGHALMAHVGDVNGDGISDILWRDYSNGNVTLWIMDAGGRPQLSGPPTPASDDIMGGGRPGLSGGLQWQVAGLGDANADHKADVIWKDARNNRLATWLMDASVVSQAVEENKGQDIVCRAVGVGDLNMDGQADIVWRNEANGEVKAWLMQAGKFSEERGIIQGSGEATQWQVKAMGDFCAPGCDDLYCQHSESSEVRIVTLDGQTFAPSAP
jgi:hypothetical protein